MDFEERVYWIGAMLRDSLYAGNSFVIFENPATEKFIQFALIDGEGFICDVPITVLSPEEEERIKTLMPETSRDMETGRLLSYQKWFDVHELYRAAELVDKLFTQIFDLPPDYELRCLSG